MLLITFILLNVQVFLLIVPIQGVILVNGIVRIYNILRSVCKEIVNLKLTLANHKKWTMLLTTFILWSVAVFLLIISYKGVIFGVVYRKFA